MDVRRENRAAQGIRFSVEVDGVEVARAYLYLMNNDLHQEPFGLMEDVFVDDSRRGEGLGTKLVNEVVAAAKENGCYKLIATSRDSRPKVHDLYRRLGFADHGREFRIDL
jgi:GNAT superfamily N-acetyltransferase